MTTALISGNFRRMAGIALATSILVAFSLPAARAQEEREERRGSAAVLLEEIVTVARKRSQAEAVQDVPVAVTAYGSQQLDALFFRQLDDLSFLMPNVQLEDVGTFPGVQNFSIRGQGINSSIPSVDPTVGVFLDGVYLGTTFGVVVDQFDLESIEVLRGPQGLLFGRNVTGGAVLLRTRRPTGEFDARVRVSGTDESQTGIAASVEGAPLGDNFAAKLVAYYDDDEGYFDNPTVGREVGAMTTKFVRPTFVWTQSEITDWTLIFETGEANGDGAPWTNVTAQRAGLQPEFLTTLNDVGFTEMEWQNAVLETNVDTMGGTLTNILGWRSSEVFSRTDVDGTSLPIFAATGFTDQSQWSNEIRWSGPLTDRWDTTIGFYWFDQDITYREGRIIQVVLNRALGGDMRARNAAAFWNNDYAINEDWNLSVGIRYTDEAKDADIIVASPVCTDITSFDCTFTALAGDWDNVTPKIGLERRIGEDTLVYGFWAKGFRSGGFNFRNAKPLVIPPGPTQEEENNTFEIGLKTEFFGGRMRLNLAAFHNKIDDIQRELNLGDQQVIVLQGTINAGDVTIEGIEGEFVALITDNFSINGTFGFQDGEYDRVNPAFASFLGEELPRLAPGNGSFGFSWDIPLAAGLVNVTGNWAYRDQNFYNDSNTEFFEEQERVNAAINYISPDERWHASIYGKNLTEEPNWGNLTSIAGMFTAGPMQKGRYYGLEIEYRY